MSENLVSEPMMLDHSTRMNPTIMQTDSSTTNPLMGLSSFNNNSTEQMPVSNLQGMNKDSMMNLTASQEILMSNESSGNFQPMANSFNTQHLPKWQLEQMKALQANQGQRNTSLSVKRKASPDNSIPNNRGMPQISAAAKRMTQARAHPNSSVPSVLSVPNKISARAGTVSYSPKSGNPNRKLVQLEAVPSRSHPQRNKDEISPKVKSEQFGSVRSKLREQVASALALVSQQQKQSDDTERQGQSETGSMNVSKQEGVKVTKTQPGEEPVDGQIASEGGIGATFEPWKIDGQEFQSNPALPYEDASFSDNFFAKDELLLGNGLAWDMDIDAKIGGVKAAEQPKAHTDALNGEKGESSRETKSTSLSPEVIADQIESELFKLHGGVNKKYKEKGRSLVFNLKDKNNPELRERVMAGEITPERLCSMTAEELASKELSEWRIAKAEELAQMKVLPDTDVDLRRLVKKTHKGEFEVESFETDLSAPVDGLVGGNSVVRDRSEATGNEAKSPSKAERAHKTDGSKHRSGTEGGKHDTGETNGTFTIPSESDDILKGLMVDDMKDLPPIVSLDEFMESLDKEPPFENLPVEKGSSDGVSESKSSEKSSKGSAESSARKGVEVGSKRTKSSGNLKPIPIKREIVWEGLLQLTVTSTANFVGEFKSGEKTGTKDWPRFIEIKGRVRLEAFEKFVHELPNSRTRAIMMVHFSMDAGCSDKDQANLKELVESYLADERLGFAEPTPGTEIYFVPPGAKTLEMLNKHLPTNYTRTLDAIENGLIGVVVWRKAQLPPPIISPKSSSSLHNKNSTIRQPPNSYPTVPATPLRPSYDMNNNSNVSFGPRDIVVTPPPVVSRPSIPDNDNNDDDDDVPPGFGPPGGAAVKREDDDLPEFNFSGSGRGRGSSISNPISQQKIPAQGIVDIPERLPSPTPPPSEDKYRQLILKYGKRDDPLPPPPLPPPPPMSGGGSGGIVLQPWNDDDDDDDIPEWQPQQSVPPILRPQMGVGNQHVQPLLPLQRPMAPPATNAGPWQAQGGSGWWDGRSVNRGRQHQQHPGGSGSVPQGRPWMPDGSSRSRNNNRGGYR